MKNSPCIFSPLIRNFSVTVSIATAVVHRFRELEKSVASHVKAEVRQWMDFKILIHMVRLVDSYFRLFSVRLSEFSTNSSANTVP